MLSKVKIYSSAAALGVTCSYIAFYIYKKFKVPRTISAAEAFNLQINVVSNIEECQTLIYELRRRSMEHKAIGFDCEWVTNGSSRNPVALLQLSSFDGYCVLLRLNCLDPLPPSLVQLLEDINIYKVGVAPLNDANYLYNDHGITTMGTLDLRHLTELCGCNVGGLAHLSETLLAVVLDKSFKVRCGNWDADTLSPAQLHYAASDAHAAIQIFVKLVNELNKPAKRKLLCLPDSDESVWECLDDLCGKYADFNYKTSSLQRKDTGNKKAKKHKDPKLSKRYPHSKRTKPFYDNCLLQAPDGELLSTCDRAKALWYIEKGLADLITDNEPLTVRLRFEPAGRSVGDTGKYYTLEKKNQCVVCGESESYIRKNVVPREYRKYFPDIMKGHSSHDVVLLCVRCHQRSNMRDQAARDRLAADCNAPLPSKNQGRAVELPAAKKVRMAARALQQYKVGKHVLPPSRIEELHADILAYFTDRTEVDDQLLLEARHLSVLVENEHYNIESHGHGVVKHYLTLDGGLLKLEEFWRTHFLTSMKPKYMPELWSTTHNLDKLRVKWNEGRLSKEQLESIGVKW